MLITVRVMRKTPPELSTDVPRMFMTVQLGEEKQVWLAGSQRNASLKEDVSTP